MLINRDKATIVRAAREILAQVTQENLDIVDENIIQDLALAIVNKIGISRGVLYQLQIAQSISQQETR